MADYYEKQRATVNIGMALKARGWNLLGLREDTSDARIDDYRPTTWDGVAIHPDYPGAVVCVNASSAKSGKDETQTIREPGPACTRCAGTGVEPNALTYEEAKVRPSEAHRNKADREAGLPRMVIAFGSANVKHIGPSVSRADYHDDGRPTCMACYGRGHTIQEKTTILFTWPTFSATPTGRAWHVEVHGRRIASGTGFSTCAAYGERGEQAAAGVADEIEAAVKRALRAATAPQSADSATPHAHQGQFATVATGGGVTVHADHDQAKEWTYLRLEPKVDRSRYDDFAARFGVRWHRMRRQPVIYRLVGADDLARFFGPLAGEEQVQPEPQVQVQQAQPEPSHIEDRAVAILTGSAPQAQPEAGLVDEATVIAFAEYFPPALWGGENQATQAHNSRAANLEAGGWSVTRTVTVGDMRQRDAIIERTPTLKASIPGEFRAAQVSQRVSAGAIRTETVPANSHLRFIMVRRGSGELYRDVDSGAVDIHLRDRYAVIVVLHQRADYLLLQIRSGMGHLSTKLYASLEEADTDAPNHLVGIPQPVTQPVAEMAPASEDRNPEAPGSGRTHFGEEFFDSDWGSTPKARKAAHARAQALQALGWRVSVDRRASNRYVVDATDPACELTTSVPGPDGLYGENAQGQQWKLYRTRRPDDEAPAAELAPEPTPDPKPEASPLARIVQMRAAVEARKVKAEAKIAALKAAGSLSFTAEEAAKRPWLEADAALHRFEADTMRAMNVPLAAEEQYLIRDWGAAAIAKRNRDIRARAYRAAGWEVKTTKTDGAFYLDAHNPWYAGAVVQVVRSNGPSSLKRITPDNLADQYQPVRLETPEAPPGDETPRPIAAPTVAVATAPTPVLSRPQPPAAPVAAKGKGKGKKGAAGPVVQLSLF